MNAGLQKRLRGWLYLHATSDNQLEEALGLDLTLEQLYGLAAGVVLIDAQTEEECGKFIEEVCELGVDREAMMVALDRADAAIMAPDEDEEGGKG